MKIHFLGGVRTVTGSMHIIESEGKKILLDCGLFEGRREEANQKNKNFPFDPKTIDAMILTHSHIDHSGNIPTLCKQGYKGNIYATFATRDLCNIMLRDSAHVQADNMNYLNKKRKKKKLPLLKPLYTSSDAEKSLRQCIAVGYERPFTITSKIKGTFYNAGHILGAGVIKLSVKEKNKTTKILYTGDLGRPKNWIIKGPSCITDCDYLITESTYGNRFHDPYENIEDKLANIVTKTIKRKGKIIIPSFSVGRTQDIVFVLHKLVEQKKIPVIPIFVDSPLSVNATEIFRLHPECYNQEAYKYIARNENPFGFDNIRYIRTTSASKELNTYKKPCIIISSSGMCEAGRILHHLKNNIEDKKNTILIVSFSAKNTLGRKIVEKLETVRIFGDEYKLNAEVVVMNAFSAHADRNELLEYISSINKKLKKIFVVHGDEDQSESFGDAVRKQENIETIVPYPGDIFEI
ncbi:MBL fold metallo-hydrolase RNA specificity domain-containing protein [Chlamydiota bacterium]